MDELADPLIGAILLCGGQSRRMGRDKAWLDIAGEPLLHRVARILRSVCPGDLVTVAAPGQSLPELPPGSIVARDPTPFDGPLQGLIAGLEALPLRNHAAYVSSCDAVLLHPGFVEAVCQFWRSRTAEIAIPHAEGRRQPLSACYRRSVLPTARRLFADGERRARALCGPCSFEDVPLAALLAADPHLLSLKSANSPAEFAALAARAGESET